MPMTSTDVCDATVHYLVVDECGDEQIYVFLDRDPSRSRNGPQAEAVTLQLLPGGRYSPPVEIAARPILGQDPHSALHFREFRCTADMMRANFQPVAFYRVCESWDDYLNPWR